MRMKSFQEISMPEELQKALEDLNFEKPTEIQQAVIPQSSKNKDIIACAQTGSGKTAAYGIPLISKLIADSSRTGLVLAPTRELAHQISDFLRELSSHCENFLVTSLVGGADMRRQLKALKRKPRVIVATPGRLTDHLKRRSLSLKSTHFLVLDEGDRMLDMGFSPQLDVILTYLPKKRQTSLFTATLPDKVRKLCEKYLSDPVHITVGPASLPVAAIKQSVIQLTFQEKDDRIVDELNARKGSIIIFARTKNRADILNGILKDYGFSVGLIHGGRSQGQRNKAIQDFKKGKSRILCATDIAARGIDVPQVEHVINFDLPMMDEDYVHRIGRTARNGAKGEAVSFVMPNEHRAWQAIARKYKIPGVELETKSNKGKSKGKKQFASKEEYLEELGEFVKKPFRKKKKFSKKSNSKKFGKPGQGPKKKAKSSKKSNGFRKKKASNSFSNNKRTR